jgi:hypothetical protein
LKEDLTVFFSFPYPYPINYLHISGGGNQFGNGIDDEYDDYDNLGNGRRTNPLNPNRPNNNNQIDDYYDGMEGNGGIVGPLPNDYGTGGGQNWNSGTSQAQIRNPPYPIF